MRIAVCVKQVLDPSLPLEFNEREGRIVRPGRNAVLTINPSDRAALEEAIRLRQGGGFKEVAVVTLGPAEAEEVVRYCLARGADQGMHLLGEVHDSHTAAVALSYALRRLGFDLILCGSKSIDEATGQVPPILAELLDLPRVSGAVRLEVDAKEMKAKVWRWLERGNRELIECDLPAVVAVEPSIREMRYVSIHCLRRARGREVQRISLSSLIDVGEPLSRTVKVSPPRVRPKKTFMPDSSLSANERIALLLGGGPPRSKKGSQVLGGSREEIASQVIPFLRTEGII